MHSRSELHWAAYLDEKGHIPLYVPSRTWYAGLLTKSYQRYQPCGAKQRLSTRLVVGLRFRQYGERATSTMCYALPAAVLAIFTGILVGDADMFFFFPRLPHLLKKLDDRSRLCGKSHQILKSNIASFVSAFKKIKNQFWKFPKVFLLTGS